MGRLLAIKERNVNNMRIIDLEGEITLVDAKEFKKAVYSEIDMPNINGIVINLKEVPYVDSIGLGILLEMNKTVAEKGYTFSLMNLTPNVMELMDLSQGKKFFTIISEEDI
jgi:anti-anti-sigma factor